MDNFTENKLLDMYEDEDPEVRSLASSLLDIKISEENQTLTQAVSTILNLASGFLSYKSGFLGYQVYKRQYHYAKKVLDKFVELNDISLEGLEIEKEIQEKELRRKRYNLLKIEFGDE